MNNDCEVMRNSLDQLRHRQCFLLCSCKQFTRKSLTSTHIYTSINETDGVVKRMKIDKYGIKKGCLCFSTFHTNFVERQIITNLSIILVAYFVSKMDSIGFLFLDF